MRRALSLILAVLIVALVATRVHVRPGAGGATATDVTMLAVSPAGVYWVTQPQDGLATLQHARRLGGRAQQVATAPDIRSLAVVGRRCCT
mgnify:CR=1 FL=1